MTAVSVVMSTYNDASVLSETLCSVLAQDLAELELIVVNDGSTDPSVAAELQQATQHDSRIRVLTKLNEGLTRALIDGCAIARGNYIARIDAGDVMLPGRLAAQAQVLDEHKECAFVSCWTEFCGPHWEPMWLTRGVPSSADGPVSVLAADPAKGLLGDVPHHGAVMFRRSAYRQVGGYRPEFYFAQDWDLWYRLAEIGHYCVVPRALYRARFFPSSISMTRKRFQDEIERCARGAFTARRNGQDESVWLEQARQCNPDALSPHKTGASNSRSESRQKINHEPGLYFIGEALRRRGDPRARRYLSEAMRHSPTSPRAYMRWLQSWIPTTEPPS